MVVLFVICLGVRNFVLFTPYVCFHILVKFRKLRGHLLVKIAAHSAYDMFSWYKYLIVNLVFPTSVFGNLFLISPFPDRCLLVPLANVLLVPSGMM